MGIWVALSRYLVGNCAVDTPWARVDSRGVRIGVLGPLEIDEVGARLGTRDRVVLSALAMSPGQLLSPEQLADAVWGDNPPPTWTKSIQGCISRLRKILGPEAIETSAHGYRLRVPSDAVDVVEFDRAARRAEELLALREYEHARYDRKSVV